MKAFACTCSHCVGCCERRPGMATPSGTEQLIKAGHGDRLMLDWWAPPGMPDVAMLVPAVQGREGGTAAAIPRGACTFLMPAQRCEIHAVAKPWECRVAGCQDATGPDEFVAEKARLIYRQWQGKGAQKLLNKWCDEHGIEGRTLEECVGPADALFGSLSMMMDW